MALQAAELRIGNWIEVQIDTDDYVVIEVTAEDITNVSEQPNLYQQIPLTEEGLLKFGFEDIIGAKVFEKGNYDLEQISSGSDEWGFYIFEQETNTKLKYVHQLQNLYFALTGEELQCQ